ncbi:MAG TPA: hypothetical protein P5572_09365 [Phycisphaerae bacterium]|nr:hypothetical protein [Phycisphaerales bacterium]HRX85211.1 hypothetical protein [Phycisphaerae bacterium]
MARSSIDELSTLIANLHEERQRHEAAIIEIDEAFARLGVAPSAPRRGRPAGQWRAVKPVAKSRRKRRRFATTANALVVATIRKAGAKGASGAQINGAWRAAGRPGDAYNTLTILTQAKAIRRTKVPGERGSRYTVR